MPEVSHNPSTRPPGDSETISQLRTSLIRALRASPQSVEPLCDALELLEGLQQRLEGKRNPDAPDQNHRRNTQSQEYIIQRTAEGQFLTERRPTGSQPFRCPKDAYLAAAKVLAGAEEPLHFDELLERLNSAMEQRQADYRLRVCLRFWGQQGLVQRFRTRYHAGDAGTFVRDAERAWEEMTSD
jgi:hypothetical protein